MAQRIDTGLFSLLSTAGALGIAWKVNVYVVGTTTRVNSYPTNADAVALTNANANPVIVPADGRIPPMWVNSAVKLVLTDALDVVLETIDETNYTDLSGSGGSALVGFLQAGSGAVARTVQAKLREYAVSVVDFGALADNSTNNTAAIQAAADYLVTVGGGTLFFPKGAAAFKTNRITIGSNMHVLYAGEIKNFDTATQDIFRITNKDNVLIEGLPGGHINAQGHQSSTIYIEGSRNVEIRGGKINGFSDSGAGDANDCIYVGGFSGTPSEDVRIRGCELYNGGRNCVSVVECFGCLIEDNEIYGAGQVRNPGAGIDVEANDHGKIRRVTIRKNKVHTNLKYGVIVIFGDDVLIDDNDIYDNAIQGILTGAGGTQFNLIANGNSSNVARADVDVLAISAYDLGTGEITVSGCAALPLGARIVPSTRNAATLASGLTSGTGYVVFDKNAANTKIRVALATSPQTVITSFADAGTGTLTAVYNTSDHYFRAYVEGQSSNIKIINNRLVNNCTDASAQVDEIQIGTSVNVTLEGNRYVPAANNVGLKVNSNRNVRVAGETILGSLASTSTSSKGMTMTANSNVIETDNAISNFITAGGVTVAGCYGQFVSERTRLYNTGSASRDPYEIINVVGPVVRDLRARNDAIYTTAEGFVATSGISKGTFDNIDMTGLGASNATSIVISGSGNIITNCVQNDGTRYLTGSATYDPASLADGAGASTTVTVTGAALGDYATASFSLSTQGITLTANVTAANTVTVRFQNETGGVIDLASGTLRAEVRKG